MDRALCARCGDIVSHLSFERLPDAWPITGAGVYAIRVAHRGAAVCEIVEVVAPLCEKLCAWEGMKSWIEDRMNHVGRIGDCGLIYIGKSTALRTRYKEMKWCHPVQIPITALYYFGWELEYGWVADVDCGVAEGKLLDEYRINHGTYPALVDKA